MRFRARGVGFRGKGPGIWIDYWALEFWSYFAPGADCVLGNVGTWLRNPGPITPNIVGFIIRNPNKGPRFLNQVPTLPL